MGYGEYKYGCTNTLKDFNKNAIWTPDDCVQIDLIDFCQPPLNTITPVTPTLDYTQYEQYKFLD